MIGSELVDSLFPQTAVKVRTALEVWQEKGLRVGITSGYRSFREQAALYRKFKQGGPQAAPPGSSFHNVRRAIDFVPLDEHGQPDWGPKGGGPDLDAYWELLEKIALEGESQGLEWGGRWKHRDGYHLQDPWCERCRVEVGSSQADHFNETGECACG